MKLKTNVKIAVLSLFVGLLGASEFIQAKGSAASAYNVDDTKIALQGYSPVSYIEKGRAEKGKKKYKASYKGINYYFTNAKQKRLFEKNPAKYEPAFGGWCAYGFAVEAGKFRADPKKFKVVNGKTLVFLNNVEVDTLAAWNNKDDQSQFRKASKYWKTVRNN